MDVKIIASRQYIYKIKKYIGYSNKKVISYVKESIKSYSLLKMFVLDVAKVNNSYFILELNCINSSGSYNHNLYKLYK